MSPRKLSSPVLLFVVVIQMRSNLKVVDNSGAKRVMCIQALKGKKGARLGDTIVASVKEAQPGGKVKKGQVVYGVLVRAAMQKGRYDGSEVKFDDNAVVLVNKQGELIRTRVFGPVLHELRMKTHEDDTMDAFTAKLNGYATKARELGKTLDESLLVRKLLDSTPDRFIQIVASIEQTSDLDDVSLDEITGKLKAFEERIKLRKESQVESQENLLFAHGEHSGKGR
nr:ribosomal protein L14, bacterial-type [Tanacetum cinerariifolium]